MKLATRLSHSKGIRKPWILIWLPLCSALLVSLLNIYLQKQTYDLESVHIPYLKLELQLAEVDGMLDSLPKLDNWSEDDSKHVTASEKVFQDGITTLGRTGSYAPRLKELAGTYHQGFTREVGLFQAGQISKGMIVDANEVDLQADELQAEMMVAHNNIRYATSRMHSIQTALSTLAIFALAFGSVVLFLTFEKSRHRSAMATENILRNHNGQLEVAVLERTKEIEFQALHDKLTGLANRALFYDRVEFALNKANRTHLGTAAIFLDLDNFKLVNDCLGHAAGDELLVAVAGRLLQAVRPGDTVARMGGDEFTVLLEDLDSVEQAEIIANRVLQGLRQSITVQGREAFAFGSIGIAFTPHHETTATELMKNADTAMYCAKADGKGKFVVWNAGMNDRAVERLELETDLRKALDNDELCVHYQPLIDLTSGNLLGAEALARWFHPTRGLVSPSQFIPIAEESGMIHSIGYWVLEEACGQAVKWQVEFGMPDFSICVNLSGRQLQTNDVVERVAEILERTNLKPSCLKIEITESILMSDREDVVAKMQRLHALGIKLALDDFGTGYSSLSRLSVFPVDTLKIDRAFISHLGVEGDATAVVEAIIALSKSLKMDVVGEGVETQCQMSVLRSLGCQMGQGYLFAKPLTVEDFSEELTRISSAGGHWDVVRIKIREQQAA